MWDAVASIYKEAIHHPFVLQLADGTLKKRNFAHYLTQDILYIRDDNLALNLAAEKAPGKAEKQFFLTLARDGLDLEKALHNEFLEHFNIKGTKEKSPVIKKYTSFLLYHSKNSSFALSAAALLPCFWLYNSVGKHLLAITRPNNPYQIWIDTYHSDEYERYTQQFIQIVEQLASREEKKRRQEMLETFVLSARFERDFFDEAMKI